MTLNSCSGPSTPLKTLNASKAVNCLLMGGGKHGTQTARGVSVARAKQNNDSLEQAQEQMALQEPFSAL